VEALLTTANGEVDAVSLPHTVKRLYGVVVPMPNPEAVSRARSEPETIKFMFPVVPAPIPVVESPLLE
jgi:hypothetical protein